jgi:ferritin-like protein
MSSEGYHEPVERLQGATIDRHRAITSIMEELEAVDWYDQRVDATNDPELASVLGHNRDEEKEHAAMVIEWLRRQDATFDGHLRTYLFTEGPIVAIEQEAEDGGEGGGDAPAPGSDAAGLGIGSLKGA